MDRVKTLIREIHNIINVIALGNVLINATLIFLSLYFVLSFINFKPMLAVWPATLYFVLTLYHRIPYQKLDIVEKKFPHLEGKLLTAYDNENVDNPIAQELEEECITDIKRVKTSEFIDMQAMVKKIGVIFLLGFGTIVLASVHITLEDVVEAVKDAVTFAPGKNTLLGSRGGSDDGDFELYDELTSDAIIGTEALKLEIHQDDLVEVDNVQDVSEREFIDNPFPEISFDNKGSAAFEDTRATEHKTVVEDYFKSVTSG